MDVLSRRSTLNPHAPLFVPLAYRTVEDFSDQWWALVQSSPCFRDYWLRERFHDPQNEDDDLLFPDDLDLVFDDYNDFLFDSTLLTEEKKADDSRKELVPLGTLRWRKGLVAAESRRLYEKAPKIVSVKVSPRMIQQPR